MSSPVFFHPPANLKDFQNENSYAVWSKWVSDTINYSLQPSLVLGIPRGSSFQVPEGFQSQWFNQKDHPEYPVTAADVHWNAFPKRILQNFNGNQLAAWKNADAPQILGQSDFAGYGGHENQYIRVQDEYCEWFVHRNEAGEVIRIELTAEGPEYWKRMYELEPDTLLALYKHYVSDEVTLDDLTYRGRYNPQNVWNTTKGIMHLNCPPNSLSAEIILGAQATAIRKDDNGDIITDSSKLINCSQYGDPSRNSDPTIGSAVNSLARTGVSLSLLDPVGLYISFIDTTGWTVNGEQLTDEQLEKIIVCTRGTKGSPEKPGKGLRYSISVPDGMGFALKDISINAIPLQWGGQIASVTTIHLTAIATQSGPGVQVAVPCVRKYSAGPFVSAFAVNMNNNDDEESAEPTYAVRYIPK